MQNIYSIDELKTIVGNVAKKYGVKKAALFGSYSHGTANENSDIDLIIDKGDIRGLIMFNSFVNALSDALKKPVDIVTYASLENSVFSMNSRDRIILIKIVQYSEEIQATVERFSATRESFAADHVVKNVVAMCILQIGELSGRLTDEFKETHKDVPWREIKAMRNIAAHNYGEMDIDILWETALYDIPELKKIAK